MTLRDTSRENDANRYKERYERSYGSTGNNETRNGVLRIKSITTHSNGITLVFPGFHITKQTSMDGVVQGISPHHQLCNHEHQNSTIYHKQHHSSLRGTCKAPIPTQICQIRYVAVSIQNHYKHEQNYNTNDFHTKISVFRDLVEIPDSH